MSPEAERIAQRDEAKSSRRLIVAAFTLVGVGALVTTLFSVAQTRRLESNARTVVDGMLTSIRLVGRLENQVERRRTLVSDHIVASDLEEMAHLDAQLATVDAQIAANIRDYEPWVDLPGERAIWDRSQKDLAMLDRPIAQVLALSRRNKDVEAGQVLNRIAPQFALVAKDFDELIAINDRGATASLSAFSMIRRRLVMTLLGLGAAAVLGTFVVGRWALRQVTKREEAMTINATRLEARNRDLDAFAGRVAHDIRGNLAVITLAMTPLSAKVPKDDRAMQILRRGTLKMTALVEDLLALARVEAFVRGRCDPANVVAQIEQDLAARIDAEKGTLRVSVTPAQIACSEGLFRQAVTNLIDNAIKYRRLEVAPVVAISGTPIDGGYDLRVVDNGVGMSADETKRVFEPFYRSPRMRDVPGTGLGLAIVSRVVEASGGALSVDSSLGQGSTFVMNLRLANGDGPGAAEMGS